MQRFQENLLVSVSGVLVPASAATVTVYNAGTTTVSTIYSTNALGAQANPFTASTDGLVAFYAADGRYDITISGSGLTTTTVSDVLFDDTAPSASPTYNVVSLTGGVVMPKASGAGIKVDTAAPTFGWKDLIGIVHPKAVGAGSPTRAVYMGGSVGQYAFAVNDVCDFEFHIPHDHVPGTAVYFHVHWSHTGTAISGDAVFTVYHTYSKGHNQAIFPAEKSVTVTHTTTDIATTPRYRHRIDEVLLSTAGGSGSLMDTALLEPDGLILAMVKLTTLPTITGGSLFIHLCDLHYQSTGMATKQKAPDFYT